MSPALGYGERLRRTERAISFIRLGVVAFNSILFLSLAGSDQHRELALAIIAIAGIYAVFTVAYNPERLAPNVLPVATMVADNILIALWLYATGGYDSPFFPLFYAEAAASVGRFGWMIGTFSAIGSAFLYLFVVAVDTPAPAYDVIARTGYIFVIVAFVSYVVEVARGSERDAAAAEAAAEAHAELSRLKGAFVSTISHELRTPLTTIKGATATILKGTNELSDAQRQELVEAVDRQSAHLSKLVQDLIDVATLERGDLDFEPTPTDVSVLVKAEAAFAAQRTNREIVVESNGHVPEVHCDPPMIRRAIANIIDNAIKFSPEDSSVRIDVKDLGFEVAIDIVDEGIGIARSEQDRIFDRFYQVDSSMTRKAYGAGIGLPLARELVRLHRGDVKVSSELGKGARFRVVLPKGQLKPS